MQQTYVNVSKGRQSIDTEWISIVFMQTPWMDIRLGNIFAKTALWFTNFYFTVETLMVKSSWCKNNFVLTPQPRSCSESLFSKNGSFPFIISCTCFYIFIGTETICHESFLYPISVPGSDLFFFLQSGRPEIDEFSVTCHWKTSSTCRATITLIWVSISRFSKCHFHSIRNSI